MEIIAQLLMVSGDITIDGKIKNKQFTSIETENKTLEEMLADVLLFEDGLDDFIINVQTDEYNIIDITFDENTDCVSDIFELIFPSNMNLSMNNI